MDGGAFPRVLEKKRERKSEKGQACWFEKGVRERTVRFEKGQGSRKKVREGVRERTESMGSRKHE